MFFLFIGANSWRGTSFLGHDDIATTRIYADTSAATLRHKFDQITDSGGRALVQAIAAS
ncbi:hypothetical protein [Azospirillum sp. sgz302134]